MSSQEHWMMSQLVSTKNGVAPANHKWFGGFASSCAEIAAPCAKPSETGKAE